MCIYLFSFSDIDECGYYVNVTTGKNQTICFSSYGLGAVCINTGGKYLCLRLLGSTINDNAKTGQYFTIHYHMLIQTTCNASNNDA